MNLPVGKKCCSVKQRKEIVAEFDVAMRWNNKEGYPLHLGEFGSHHKADMASRVEYTKFVRKASEDRGIGWAYWEFGSSFGIYNRRENQWREPLVDALFAR